MTKAAGKTAKKAAAKPAAETDETKNPETEPTEDGAIADAAPLDAPGDDAEDSEDSEDSEGSEGPEADGGAEGDGPAEGGDAGGEPDLTVNPTIELPKDEPKPPASAQLDPPAPKEKDAGDGDPRVSIAEAAAERANNSKARLTITDERDNPLDPDAVFSEPDANGECRALVRLIKHETIDYGREVRTLFLARGQRISERAAQRVVARIQAEQA